MNSDEKDTTNNNNKLIDIKDDLYHSVLKPGIKTTEDFLTLVYTPRAILKLNQSHVQMQQLQDMDPLFYVVHLLLMIQSYVFRLVILLLVYGIVIPKPIAYIKWPFKLGIMCHLFPDGKLIATGSMDNTIRLWDATTGKPVGKPLLGHSKWVSSLSWEPFTFS